jgi:formate-dependent nitrite reductase membrane component NrfD
MIQAKPYEFMVKYTPQREWIENRGILMWLATFFIEVGAATFLISSIFGNLWGMFVGVVMCAILGGGLHFADLGHPLRSWRMLFSCGWKTSWIARGMWFINIFIVLSVTYLGLTMWLYSIPGLLIASNVFAFCTIIYFGFVLSYVNGLALWNSALLPMLILVLSIWGGLDIFMLTSLVTGTESVTAELWSRIIILFVIFIIVLYLFGIRYKGVGGRVSFGEIVWRKRAPLFWVLVVLFGAVFPLIVGLTDMFLFNVPNIILCISIFFELGANLTLRYCLLKYAFYEPIIPSSSYAT